MSWSAQITGLTELAPELQAAARLGIHDGMELLGIEGQRMVQDNIASPYNGRPAAVDTMNYLNGVLPEVDEEQALTRLTIGISQSLAAGAYAAAVDGGAVPHMPPVEALIPWVQRKLGATDEKAATSLAWAIAMSIKKKGMLGHMDFERGLEQLEPLAVPVLERAIGARLLAITGGVA